MKIVLFSIIVAASLLPLHADDFFQNTNFSQGATGWNGNFQAGPADPNAAAKGLVIQLKPHEWTSISQQALIKSQRLQVHLQMTLSADAACSTDAHDFEDIANKIGLSDRLGEVASVPLRDKGATGKAFIVVTGNPGVRGYGISHEIKWGDPKHQGVIGVFDLGEPNSTRKVTVALPPGTGTVTLTQLTAEGSQNDGPLFPGMAQNAAGSATLTELPPAPEDELVTNADFHDGLNNWTGDLKLPSDLQPGDSSFPPVAPAPQTGAFFELRGARWVKASQVIDLPSPFCIVTVYYACSGDLKYSERSTDYENIRQGMDMPGFSRGRPGEWVVFTEEPEDQNLFFGSAKFPPPLEGAKISMERKRPVLPNTSHKLRVTIAFPPGSGKIMIYRVSVRPSDADPIHPHRGPAN